MRRWLLLFSALLLLICVTACTGSGRHDGPPVLPPAFSVSLTPTSVQVPQDGSASSAPATLSVTRSTTNALTITQTGLPSGITMTVDSTVPNSPTLTFKVTNPAQATAGDHAISITVSDGASSATKSLTVTVVVVASIHATSTMHSNMFMSTSFQPAEWDYQFFQTNTVARMQALDELGSRHINLQPMAGATVNLDPSQATPLDFSKMDAIVQPVLQVTDGSPLFQLYAPSWMWVNGDSSKAMVDPTFNQFADWAAMIVKYYNVPGGFTLNGTTYASAAAKPIKWWGIFNEPNLTSLTPQQYVQLYNVTAAKMLAVDPTIKLVGVELSDWGNEPQRYLPAFVQGVTQQVDALATHYYGTCNQRSTDQQVFDSVQMFHDHVIYFHQQMATNPTLASLPVWVTENNVNADFAASGGSACNPGQPFVTDTRGSNAYFAAWRPLVFSQLMDAGADSIHHWDYNADLQYGEVDFTTGNKQVSYWVDYWLAQYMTDAAGVDVLPVTSTQTSTLEIKAIRKADGSVGILIANYAVANPTDNNGAGALRTVTLDTSALGSFKSASKITIDSKLAAGAAPLEVTGTSSNPMNIALDGYGVVLVKLVP